MGDIIQVLKENVRISILNATREEVLLYGLDGISLRRIARKLGMSTSNIYNYFANKETLIFSLIQPSINEIEKVLKELTKNMIDFNQQSNTNLKLKVSLSIEQLAIRLIELFKSFDESVFIILTSEKYLNSTYTWLEKVLLTNYDELFNPNDDQNTKVVMVKLMTPAIISGFIICIQNIEYCNNNNVDITYVIKKYLSQLFN